MENAQKQMSYESCHDHNMIGHDTCYEGINTPITCHDSNIRLSKTDWWYLVNTLTEWRVFNPRAVVKKNPAAAWKCMNLCKDNNVRIPGAYFTICFRNECAKAESKKKILELQNTLEKRIAV